MSGDAQRRWILHMAVSLDSFVARSDGRVPTRRALAGMKRTHGSGHL